MKPSRTHHLAIKVFDLAGAEAFYGGVLGLSVIRRWPSVDPDDVRDRSIWLDLGQGAFLALERATDEQPAKPDGAPGLHLLALHIDRGDRDAWRTRLEHAGYPVTHETDYTLYVADPEGNRIGLSHWPDAV